MPTARERLDQLTTRLHNGLDRIEATGDPNPVGSLARLSDDIDALSAAATGELAVAQTELDAINADIAVITDLTPAERTDLQKRELSLLRHIKSVQQRNIASLRMELTLLRTLRSLSRTVIVNARFSMMLDGGPARVRQSDLDADEGDDG